MPIPYPNPVGDQDSVHVHLSFGEPEGIGRLVLFTTAQRRVAEVRLGNIAPGEMTVLLPLTGPSGEKLANGVYFLAVITLKGEAVGKLLILR